MITREKVLITVKKYPTLSEKYGELVCTAGVKEDGSWIRIYPFPFRRFKEYRRFKKYTWIELPLRRNSSDPRPESYRPAGWDEIKILETIGTKNNWEARKKIILKDNIYNNIDLLIKRAKENQLSLAVFKPTEILDFTWDEVDKEWDKKKLESVLMDLT